MMNCVRGPLLVTPPGADAGGSHCVRGPLWARQAERTGYAD